MAQLLITQEYLKEMSVIDDNVDFTKLTPIIKNVQKLSIRPLLGTNLYNLIVSQSTPPGSLTADNQLLLDEYILDCMQMFLMAKSPMVFKFRYQNKGIMVKSSENSQPAETNDLYRLTDFWKNEAEALGQDMQDFIRANPTKYPSFFTNTGIDQKQPNADAFDTDMYLPETCKPYYSWER